MLSLLLLLLLLLQQLNPMSRSVLMPSRLSQRTLRAVHTGIAGR
jgi:hypothetical protein